jgi:uncharacterized protein YciI
MRIVKNIRQLFADGQSLEQAGQPEDAAAAYQQVIDADPGNQEAVGRLLVIYRRLKDYRKELGVIQAALDAIEQRGKAAQEKWISGHPGAAKLGRQVLRSLGSEAASGYGANAVAEKLLKRRAFVEKRTGGGKKGGTTAKKKTNGKVRRLPKRAEQDAAGKRRKELEVKKRRDEERKIAAEAREKAAEKRKAEADSRQAEKEAKERPSLFVISLRYLVPLEKIDAAMKKHVAFLDKHFERKDFLISGRQVPRTGGIIIARGKNRAAVERIMKQDPFVKAKLAAMDIVEFVANKLGKGLNVF